MIRFTRRDGGTSSRRFTTLSLRIGIGYDIHRIGEGGSLRLGGVEITHDFHLIGHSDADVLLHAITDALLGAAGLGDIGEMFPSDDAVNRDRNSAEMLQLAHEKVAQANYTIINLDCIVHAQRPKLSPYKETICRKIAEILSMLPEQIGIKGKTGENVGPIGQQEAIAAQCVVLLEKNETTKVI